MIHAGDDQFIAGPSPAEGAGQGDCLSGHSLEVCRSAIRLQRLQQHRIVQAAVKPALVLWGLHAPYSRQAAGLQDVWEERGGESQLLPVVPPQRVPSVAGSRRWAGAT